MKGNVIPHSPLDQLKENLFALDDAIEDLKIYTSLDSC